MINKKESLVEGMEEGGMMALDCKFMAVYGTCIIIILPTSIFSFVGSDRCLPVRIVNFLSYRYLFGTVGRWTKDDVQTIPQYETGNDHDDNYGHFQSYHTTNACGGPVPLDSSVVVRCESQVVFVPTPVIKNQLM